MRRFFCLSLLAAMFFSGLLIPNGYAHTQDEMSFAKRSFANIKFASGYNDASVLFVSICFEERTDENGRYCAQKTEIPVSDIWFEVDISLPPGTAMVSGTYIKPNPRSSVAMNTTIFLPSEAERAAWKNAFTDGVAKFNKARQDAGAPQKVNPPTLW